MSWWRKQIINGGSLNYFNNKKRQNEAFRIVYFLRICEKTFSLISWPNLKVSNIDENQNCECELCFTILYITCKKKEKKNEIPSFKIAFRTDQPQEILARALTRVVLVASFYPPDKMEEYGIASFGVSVTTLEEVFMKVGEGAEKTVDDL